MKILKKPVVCFDVDGVLRKGKQALPGAKQAIIKLREKGIPISLLTNGGGEPEFKRANVINKLLGLENEYQIKGEEVFLCHSPMRKALEKKTDGHVLITGTGDIKSVMKHYGFENFITVEEYSQIFPDLFPNFFVDAKYIFVNIVRIRLE
jgi:HAD superfamily hydrolase (TIGR01450 family)